MDDNGRINLLLLLLMILLPLLRCDAMFQSNPILQFIGRDKHYTVLYGTFRTGTVPNDRREMEIDFFIFCSDPRKSYAAYFS